MSSRSTGRTRASSSSAARSASTSTRKKSRATSATSRSNNRAPRSSDERAPVALFGDQTAGDSADDLQTVRHDVQSGLSERSRRADPHDGEQHDAEDCDQHTVQYEGWVDGV